MDVKITNVKTLKVSNSGVIKDNIWPPNFFRWNSDFCDIFELFWVPTKLEIIPPLFEPQFGLHYLRHFINFHQLSDKKFETDNNWLWKVSNFNLTPSLSGFWIWEFLSHNFIQINKTFPDWRVQRVWSICCNRWKSSDRDHVHLKLMY